MNMNQVSATISIAMPQIGPGKGDGNDGHDDLGRERVSGDPADRCGFRTPSLRNVAVTGPWGHDGAYGSLRDVVEHHLDPVGALENYDTTQALLPPRDDLDAVDWIAHNDPARRQAIAATNDLRRVRLRPGEVDALMDFLQALTDPLVLNPGRDIPRRVPSGLPLAE